MSEDLFANPYSTIPDELWRAPSPRDRQLAAVEYWADLTGIQKTASKAEMIRRVRKTLASMTPEDEARITGGIMATIGAGGSLLATRKKPQDEELTVANGIRTKRPSAEQLDLRAERASLKSELRVGMPVSTGLSCKTSKNGLRRYRRKIRFSLRRLLEG